MFIKELILNIKYLEEQVLELTDKDSKTAKDLLHFSLNLLKGIAYYRELSSRITDDSTVFGEQLTGCENEINDLIGKLENFAIA